jgi:hypothetical protein
MTIAEQIYAIAKNLPQDQAIEILAFAESIRSKNLSNIDNSESIDQQTSWADFVYSLAGAWSGDFPTLEEIRAKEGQGISRESL